MKSGWFIGFLMLFVICSIISGIAEQTVIGAGEMTKMQTLMTMPNTTSLSTIGAVFAYIDYSKDVIAVLWDMFWWNYSFLQGEWLYAKYLLFMPISIGMALTFVLAIRGTGGG